MSPALAMLLGGLAGAGALLAWRGAFPRPAPLASVLVDLSRPRPSMADRRSAPPMATASWRERLSRAGMRWAVTSSDDVELRRRLRVAGRTIEQHAFDKVLGASVGLFFPPLFALVLAAGGVAVAPVGVTLAAAALAAAGFFYPALPLRDKVEERRLAFRHALSSYLDLVTIVLAGGGGVETALVSAAEAGGGFAFVEIRGALGRARLTKRSPWDGLDELGEELGVEELRQLAASVRLAGQDGARVRNSVAAKADALRGHQAAQVEARAEAATERMLVPVIFLTLGLILFVGFGAVSAITDGGATSAVIAP
ncbi:MAG: type II secretion system F family protein [Acidimicrobiales bacterium]